MLTTAEQNNKLNELTIEYRKAVGTECDSALEAIMDVCKALM